ncbi:hypothetical protein SUGI_0303850 [Cryptomeria japonica]|nr:hypothetical protein SUGI_0303850 [Cryptomeria japonica]
MASNGALQSLLHLLAIFFFVFQLVMSKSFGTSVNMTKAENAVEYHVEKPELVAQMVERSLNTSRRQLSYMSCGTGNPVDDYAIGGQNGRFYIVTDPNDDDPVNPRPGTLRHAVIQTEPLWIIFQRDMVIQLKEELIMNSYKTIDGRGANVHIANGACITIQYVNNIIIHGIHIHDCKPAGNTNVRSSPTHYGYRTRSDGDGITIHGSSAIWVDHCSLSSCTDGLIDATRGSTAITISNSFFTHHDKVMLLGHSDDYTQDVKMQVTVAFNHFGEGLVQRMPRCRHGYFHVVNNDYTHWEMYAIGGSANPTINSQGNRFLASDSHKDVTKHEDAPETGASSSYTKASSMAARPSSIVGSITATSGVLTCRKGSRC